MNKKLVAGLFMATTLFVFNPARSQNINAKEVERIEKYLSSDELRGRKTFSPELDKAAAFIADEFKKAGLKPLEGNSYRQEFSLVRTKPVSVSGKWGETTLDGKSVIAVSCLPELKINQSSGFEVTTIGAGLNLQQEARKLVKENKNRIALVDKSYANSFGNLGRLRSNLFKTDKSVVFVLADQLASVFSIEISQEITEQKMANVVGILPGKSKKDEYVIFSGHYDHLGVGKPADGDSIYNGANDDAAGTTAVIMLAHHLKSLKNNERTIVFAAFTAEEIGGWGSQYFSKQMNPDKVMAMFNIEMIGTPSKWGNNSAYITGYERTDMGKIMEKNLEGTGFTFYPDPYPQQQLFYRSDNATLARLGVPAHTISTSKMDSEPYYHTVNDEIETLDMENMARIIQSIALSARSIIAGKDTPTRVKVEELR